jgi:hypothetical protein
MQATSPSSNLHLSTTSVLYEWMVVVVVVV